MKFIPSNAQAIGARSEQQDAFGFSDPADAAFVAHSGLLGVLADGMGGLAFGGLASQAAVSRFIEAYSAKSPDESISNALSRSLSEANDAVLGIAYGQGLLDQVGTTLVAAVVHDGCLEWISAGDSRIYLVREGAAIQLTTDHVYGAQLDSLAARGQISQTEAMSDPQRGDLTSYLGKLCLKEVDRSPASLPLQPGDAIIVCSDGLYKVVTPDELADLVDAARNGKAVISELLLERALDQRRPNQDNITILSITCCAEEDHSRLPYEKPRVRLLPVLALILVALGLLVLAAFVWRHRAAGAGPAGPTTSIALRLE